MAARNVPILVMAALTALAITPCAAADDLGYRGWGVRVGVGVDPDQVVGGAHFDCGEIVDRLRLEPNVEIGFGDDHTVLSGTAPVHWLFEVDSRVQPYAGGGVALAWIDRDLPPTAQGDDSDVEFAVKLIGGLEWALSNDRRFRVELALHAGDIYDAQIMAAWSF